MKSSLLVNLGEHFNVANLDEKLTFFMSNKYNDKLSVSDLHSYSTFRIRGFSQSPGTVLKLEAFYEVGKDYRKVIPSLLSYFFLRMKHKIFSPNLVYYPYMKQSQSLKLPPVEPCYLVQFQVEVIHILTRFTDFMQIWVDILLLCIVTFLDRTGIIMSVTDQP